MKEEVIKKRYFCPPDFGVVDKFDFCRGDENELYLSFDEGMQKPNPAIFKRCLEKLDVKEDECLYVGDGGSNELEAAEALGMKAVQAVWYLKEGTTQPTQRKEEFEHAETLMDIIDFI